MTDENVVTKKNGVGAYGLFIDYVRVDGEGHLVTQERLFLTQHMLSSYTRDKGSKRASWEVEAFASHNDAREALIQKVSFDSERAVMTAEPIMVELTATDIQQINNGEAPHSRHAGVIAIEKTVGKVDDAHTWDLPPGLWKTVEDDDEEPPF